MENREALAEYYAHNYFNMHETNNYKALKQGFLAGFEANQPKWINIKDKLPNDDRVVLVWIDCLQNPQWSDYGLGSFQNEKWYVKNGRKTYKK